MAEEKARARQGAEEVWEAVAAWGRLETVSAQVAEKKSLMSGGIPALILNVPNAGLR